MISLPTLLNNIDNLSVTKRAFVLLASAVSDNDNTLQTYGFFFLKKKELHVLVDY
jgi:hypothetical protein